MVHSHIVVKFQLLFDVSLSRVEVLTGISSSNLFYLVFDRIRFDGERPLDVTLAELATGNISLMKDKWHGTQIMAFIFHGVC